LSPERWSSPAAARALVLPLRYVAPTGVIAASVLPILLRNG
jgi:hypothetical protein